MKHVTLVNGGVYIGHGYRFENGDYAMVEDEVGDKLLAVKDPKGIHRFREGQIEVKPDDTGGGDMTVDDLQQTLTIPKLKEKLADMNVDFPASALKEVYLDLYKKALEGKTNPTPSDSDNSDEDGEGDAHL